LTFTQVDHFNFLGFYASVFSKENVKSKLLNGHGSLCICYFACKSGQGLAYLWLD